MDAFALEGFLHAAIYGRVVLARRRATGALVAIKTMSRAHVAAHRAVAGPRVQEDGRAELETLRLLSAAAPASGADAEDRRFVLTLLEDFVDWRCDARCLVFDYCERGELFARLARDGALPAETARRCFAQVARALRFIHARGVAHRDLSLENVLLDAAGRCRVADFGLARVSGRRCAGRVGKPFYMAPEVLRSSPGDCYDGLRADMWSLGVLLFIMATGAPPWERASDADPRFRALRTRGVQALLEGWRLRDKLPAAAQALLGELLVVDPARRASISLVCARPWVADADVWGGEGAAADAPRAARAAEREPQEELDAEDAEPPAAAKHSTHEAATRERERKHVKILVNGCEPSAENPATTQSVGGEAAAAPSVDVDALVASPCVAAAEALAPTDPCASPAAWPAKSKGTAAPRCLDFGWEPARSARKSVSTSTPSIG